MADKALWPAFWAKAGAVGIRTKIVGIVSFCIITSALAMVWFTYQNISTALRNELQQRAITIGNNLATQSRDLILTDNQFSLYTMVSSMLEADEDLVYVFILNTESNILVHTFDGGFPADLLGKNKLEPGEPYHVQVLSTKDDTIQDVAIPVLGGSAGTVHLGMSEATINATVIRHIRNSLLWIALITVLGLSVAYGLSYILADPLSRLAEAARAIGRGDFNWRAPIWAKDEIGTLGTAFNEMSKELKHKEVMRTQLLAKVISAQEEERKRVARELHDETSQALTSLMVGLKFIEDSVDAVPTKEKLAELRSLAGETLEEVHHLATELRPSLLDDLGLVAAIQRYVRDYSAKFNINVDYYVSGLTGQHLSPEVEVTIYRIIQEALTNITKHAEASNVSVVLRCQNSSLTALIEDNGLGFDVDRVMSSSQGGKLGLFGMRERASLIGGSLTIESQPGSGSTIYLKAPLILSPKVADG